MSVSPKILLLDDDQDLLDLYREILTQLPSNPEIFTAATGSRALTMLESEPFTLLVSDLNMPKMDGLQVLSIVRRKFPALRTVVLTSILDEQFRARAYSMGVDMFWQKPTTEAEIKQFLECVESLIGPETKSGFRGMQSKGLVDIVQLECLSRNSTVLKITHGPLVGRIWILDGEVTDAATDNLAGEAAFRQILSWKDGNFESLPADRARPRAIMNSYQGLLLETVQAQDEAQSLAESPTTAGAVPASPMAGFSRFPGVEFVLAAIPGQGAKFEGFGLEDPQGMEDWTRQTLEAFRSLGERLQAGPLQQFQGLGPQRHVALAQCGGRDVCVGWEPNLSAGQIHESMKKILALWVS